MLEKELHTHKYIRIKEQIQNKYDNNTTIIMYNEIKLYSESTSSNQSAVNIYSQYACTHSSHIARMVFIGYKYWYISPKGFD